MAAWSSARGRWQPQHSGVAPEPLFDRESEHLHQTPRAVFANSPPRCRRARGGVLRSGRTPVFLTTVDACGRNTADFRAARSSRRTWRGAPCFARGQSALLAAAQRFGKATGLPVLYNTSFNLFGDPLVCTPRDAVLSVFTRRASSRCSSATSCCKSRGRRARFRRAAAPAAAASVPVASARRGCPR